MEWVKIISGFFSTLQRRKITTQYEKLAWLIIIATIPAALTGLIFEHILREQFAKPMAAAIFLIINGFILLAGERARRAHHDRSDFGLDTTAQNTSKIGPKRAALIGTAAQVASLFARYQPLWCHYG